jgi:hypothetical protein
MTSKPGHLAVWAAKQDDRPTRSEAMRRLCRARAEGEEMREIKSKNPLSEAVRREREEEWNS